ncbi:hypothetical protein B0H13DRAFT_2393507 [Mycena leptocephala]|nr:hypothetical protein B0H13DRAFT_2393507 [Mycena leptocephala]
MPPHLDIIAPDSQCGVGRKSLDVLPAPFPLRERAGHISLSATRPRTYPAPVVLASGAPSCGLASPPSIPPSPPASIPLSMSTPPISLDLDINGAGRRIRAVRHTQATLSLVLPYMVPYRRAAASSSLLSFIVTPLPILRVRHSSLVLHVLRDLFFRLLPFSPPVPCGSRAPLHLPYILSFPASFLSSFSLGSPRPLSSLPRTILLLPHILAFRTVLPPLVPSSFHPPPLSHPYHDTMLTTLSTAADPPRRLARRAPFEGTGPPPPPPAPSPPPPQATSTRCATPTASSLFSGATPLRANTRHTAVEAGSRFVGD